MNKLFFLYFLFNISIFAQTNEQLQKQITELQMKMNKMEKKNNSGLKMKDFGGNAASSSLSEKEKISKKQMESFMKTLNKGNKHIEARDELLKDLEDEGL